MRRDFDRHIQALRAIANRFDPDSNRIRARLMRKISQERLQFPGMLSRYHEVLLFILAFPPDHKTRSLAEREVLRSSRLLKQQPERVKALFVNSGIPFTKYRATFSHDYTRWLMTNSPGSVSLAKIENTAFDLNEALKVTLPPLLRSETTAGFTNEELLDVLIPGRKSRLHYIVNELSRLDSIPYIKDHFFDGLGLQLSVTPGSKLLSKAFNRIAVPRLFYHTELIKHVDVNALLSRKVPGETMLLQSEKENVVRVIKNSMVITERETDPATYLKTDSLRLFHLERGVSVAFYGMTPERQLPMESYIGYTLFKNGYPAVYGGGWVFGRRCDFGLNIYDQFRGGESAFMVAQVLRLYRHVFKIDYFQVEATQIGLENPEGIATGVFWFYYKLGFRPVLSGLRRIAAAEYAKISSDRTYRSSEKALLKFTEGNISLRLGKRVQPGVYDIADRVRKMIAGKFGGNSLKAEQACVAEFLSARSSKASCSKIEFDVLKEISLWASAMKVLDKRKLNLMKQMVKLKPADEYQYQERVRRFFAEYG
jgi:hypothetical protein